MTTTESAHERTGEHMVQVRAHSPLGECTVGIRCDVRELHRWVVELQDGVLDSQGQKSLMARLGALILPGPAGEIFQRTHTMAMRSGGWVRLRLLTRDWAGGSGLSWLPWELALVEIENSYEPISLIASLSLLRHEELSVGRPAFDGHAQTLRVLAAISDAVRFEGPPDAPLYRGEGPRSPHPVAREELSLLEEIAAPTGARIEAVPDPVTRQAVRAALASGDFDVVHLAGHGTAGNPAGIYVRADDAHGVDVLTAADLLVGDGNDLRLVVLNACDTAAREPGHWSAMASELVRRNIPAVVAMQLRIDDWHALRFAEVLYRELLAGGTIDRAVHAGRQELRRTQMPLEWAVPVLYCRADTGHVFGAPAPALNVHTPSFGRDLATAELWNVPFGFATDFTGRGEQLEDLHGTLVAGGSEAGRAAPSVVVIHGTSGTGKTRLAAQHAHRVRDDGSARIIWWVEAEVAPEAGLAAAAKELGLPERETLNATALAVREWFEGLAEPWLLVFDNAQYRQAVQHLVPTKGCGQVVVTTNSSVGWSPLATETMELRDLGTEEAVAYLMARSGAQDESGASRVVEVIGCLPLALQGVAAYCNHHGAPFDEAIRLLHTRPRTFLERTFDDEQRSIIDAWSLCLEKITDPVARRICRTLDWLSPERIPRSLFTSPEAVAALGAVDELEVSDALAALYSFSIIRADPGRTTFSIHRLLQRVIGDLVEEPASPLAPGLPRALELLHHAWPGDPLTLSSVAPAEVLEPHLQAVARHLLDQHEIDPSAVELLRRCVQYLAAVRPGPATLEFGERVANRLRQLGCEPTERALVHQALGAQNRSWHVHPAEGRAMARSQFDEAIRLSSAVAASADLPLLRAQRAQAVEADHLATALDEGLRAAADADRVLGRDDPRWARVHLAVAELLVSQGRYVDADVEATHGLEALRTLCREPHPYLVRALGQLGSARWRNGDYASAEHHYREALETTRALLPGERHRMVGNCLNNLAFILALRGKPQEGLALIDRSIQLTIAQGSNTTVLATRKVIRGTCLSALGEQAAAWADLSDAYSHTPQPGSHVLPRARALAEHHRRYGEHQRAFAVANSALDRPVGPRRIEHLLTVRRERAAAKVHLSDDPATADEIRSVVHQLSTVFGPDHPETARARIIEGQARLLLGDEDGAAIQVVRAMAAFTGQVDDKHLDVAWALVLADQLGLKRPLKPRT